jgi:hypothetical protein
MYDNVDKLTNGEDNIQCSLLDQSSSTFTTPPSNSPPRNTKLGDCGAVDSNAARDLPIATGN